MLTAVDVNALNYDSRLFAFFSCVGLEYLALEYGYSLKRTNRLEMHLTLCLIRPFCFALQDV